jgi:hypothetical protein
MRPSGENTLYILDRFEKFEKIGKNKHSAFLEGILGASSDF